MTQSAARWTLRRRRSGAFTSLGAASILAIAGVFLGGVVGWAAAVFFGAATLILVRQITRDEAVVSIDEHGIEVAGWREGQPSRATSWPELEGLILWTRKIEKGGRMDLLSVVRRQGDEDVGVEELVENSVPLIDCVLDADELQRVVTCHAADITVIDQRTRG